MFGGTADSLLLVRSSSEGSALDYRPLVSDFGWRNARYLNNSEQSRFLAQHRLLSEIEAYPFDKVFLGEWSSFARAVYRNCRFSEAYLMDDGTATFAQQREIVAPAKYLGWRKRFWDGVRDTRFMLLGHWGQRPIKIDFFSSIVKKSIDRERIIQHSFDALRARFYSKNSDRPKGVAFVGTYLEGSPVFNVSRMKQIHRFLESLFDPSQMFDYYLHRLNDAKLPRSYLPETRYRLIPYKNPIEMTLLSGSLQVPEVVVSTVSTALITLKVIFPHLRCIALDLRAFHNDKGAEEVYELYSQHGIELLEVPIGELGGNK